MDLKAKGIDYTYIHSGKFKTTLISVGFYLPLKHETATANALTFSLMKSGSVKYPDTYSFNRRLASLYGASVSGYLMKNGDCAEYRLAVTVNDAKYSVDGGDPVKEAGDLLCDMIFGRYEGKSDYPTDAVSREKRVLKENIEAKFNDKRIYAREKAISLMCENEAFGISAEGYAEDTENITNEDIKNSLAAFLENAFVSVFIIGSKEPESFKKEILCKLDGVKRNYEKLPESTAFASKGEKRVTEDASVKQGKLCMGLRADISTDDSESVKAWIMTDIFGGGPYSKLFCNVREKMSLCYYCSARNIKQKGIIIIDSGVEDANIEKAEKAIMHELDDMKNGKFTEKDLEQSKLGMTDSIRSVSSDQFSLLRWYSPRIMNDDPLSPDDICDLIEAVTADDVKKAAQCFALDTVFVLKPDGTASSEEDEI